MARDKYFFTEPVPMQVMMPDGTTIRELAYSTADARLAAICHGADADQVMRARVAISTEALRAAGYLGEAGKNDGSR
jgi:hypothetical protein